MIAVYAQKQFAFIQGYRGKRRELVSQTWERLYVPSLCCQAQFFGFFFFFFAVLQLSCIISCFAHSTITLTPHPSFYDCFPKACAI